MCTVYDCILERDLATKNAKCKPFLWFGPTLLVWRFETIRLVAQSTAHLPVPVSHQGLIRIASGSHQELVQGQACNPPDPHPFFCAGEV